MIGLSVKLKTFSKHFLVVLFVAYYVSITLFYHSHIINGRTISHSHFYMVHTDANGEPLSHTHSQDELIFIKIITQFFSTVVAGFLFLQFFLMILTQYQIPSKELVFSSFNQSGFSLRAPPLFAFSN